MDGAAERPSVTSSGEANGAFEAETEEVFVVFTPTGRRGKVPRGTSVLEAARRLGVDLDSV
jgi:hypothetical protein